MPLLQSTTCTDESILYVDDDNTEGPWEGTMEHPYQHIQDAIDASTDGSTIYVNNGHYVEQIIIHKSINLIGQHNEQTIIDANNQGGVVHIVEGDDILITNFTIQNGIGTAENRGFGIIADTIHSLTIVNNKIKNNDDGIVIQKESDHCLILNNEVSGSEIGIDVCTSYENIVYANTMDGNEINLILYNSNGNAVTQNSFLNSAKNLRFYNSQDAINGNYWGKTGPVSLLFGYIILPGNIYFPWIKFDFSPAQSVDDLENNPIAVMDTTKGIMTLELYPSKVPITANNFIQLSKMNFFEGIVFHRVIEDFVIQGGGYDTDGKHQESPLGTIDLEIHPEVRHVDGAISMARTNDPNSATSQFFICDGKQSNLDDNYAAFGTILLGFDVLREISSVETTTKHGMMRDWPVDDIVIQRIDIFNQ